MSHTITGSDVYPTDITVPDDGDNEDAASVVVGLGALADRTTNLRAGNMASTANTRVMNYLLATIPIGTTGWTQQIDLNGFRYIASATVNGSLLFPIAMPNESTMTAMSVRIAPNVGHSVLPIMPKWTVWKINNTTGVVTSVFVMTDDSVDVAAYETVHSIFSAVVETIDNTLYSYILEFTSEGGPDAVSGLEVYGAFSFNVAAKRDPSAS